ncbi:hypothetical protein Tco_1241022 [Tanacetum coccineum]
MYLYKLAITLSRLQRSVQFGTHSDHSKVQDRLDEELGNETDVVPFGLSIMCQTEPDDVNHASVNKDTHHGEDIHNDSDPQDCQYDVDSRENEGCKDDDDVKIDEEHEIHKDEVEFHLFGIKESDYQFTTIGVSSEVADNVFMEEGGYEMDTNSGGEGDGPSGRRSALNKLKKAFIKSWDPVKAVQDLLQRELTIHISMSKAIRAKIKADKEVRGDHFLQYQKLRDYVVELQSTNPSTTVK